MLTESGAKLLDFGLARAPALVSAASSTVSFPQDKLSVEGTIIGTFQYMAPEQLDGKKAARALELDPSFAEARAWYAATAVLPDAHDSGRHAPAAG